MTPQSVEIIFTDEFDRQAKRAKVPPDKIREIIVTLQARPDSGVLVPGTGGARKVRFAGRGKGKSGGYRVITGLVIFRVRSLVYLLTIYAESDKVDLTQGDKRWIRAEMDILRSSEDPSS